MERFTIWFNMIFTMFSTMGFCFYHVLTCPMDKPSKLFRAFSRRSLISCIKAGSEVELLQVDGFESWIIYIIDMDPEWKNCIE